ncbi:HPr kinase/phosphorylase [Acuticoccus mangrovi]|uniref:Serine kinase n=1 Tax=Acuticoccus mangrovi TaxID=2796142 RepID=A0A934ITF2_9HYPH|nr:serine kinase [Acuticoccus mangrovi]MBJ3777705.1 serine kinase [Acuticoccus mangrovi]
MTVHATALAVGEAGLLVRGPSGAGKSSLALALIVRARAAGRFARLVADDRTILSAAGGRLLAGCPPPLAGLIEIAGHGIAAAERLPAVRLTLVVNLVAPADVARMPEAEAREISLHGVPIAQMALAMRQSAHSALVLEALLEGNGLTDRPLRAQRRRDKGSAPSRQQGDVR